MKSFELKNTYCHQSIIYEYVDRLLKETGRQNIAKIYLFGSVKKHKADEFSDIDLFIVCFNKKNILEEKSIDISFDLMNRYNKFIEPHIYDIYQWLFPQSYFVYNATRNGKEIYTMNKKELKENEIKGFKELAEEYNESAKLLYENKLYRGTVDQAYNSIELCLKGFLLNKMDDLPNRHSAVVDKFIELYLKPGIFSRDWSKKLKYAFKKRNEARYSPVSIITQQDADDVLSFNKEILKKI